MTFIRNEQNPIVPKAIFEGILATPPSKFGNQIKAKLVLSFATDLPPLASSCWLGAPEDRPSGLPMPRSQHTQHARQRYCTDDIALPSALQCRVCFELAGCVCVEISLELSCTRCQQADCEPTLRIRSHKAPAQLPRRARQSTHESRLCGKC